MASDGCDPTTGHTGEGRYPWQRWVPAFAGKPGTESSVWFLPRESPYALIGTAEEIVADLVARRQRWGFSYYTVQEPYLDALAPAVARLAGG